MLQPSPLRGLGCNSLLHSALVKENVYFRVACPWDLNSCILMCFFFFFFFFLGGGGGGICSSDLIE